MMKNTPLGLIGALTLALAACAPTATTSTQGSLDVKIVSVNDFHGNLLPTGFRVPDPADRTKTLNVQAGGIETIGTLVKNAKAQNPNTIFVGVGDLVGASPLVSGLLRDEPTIIAMNRLGMEVSVLGNHEFDYGLRELQRLQNGGCDSNDAAKACKFAPTFEGAKFKYIAANVVDERSGARVFPAYFVREIGGVKVGFVGAVLQSTPTIVVPSGVAGLRFEAEAESINRVIPELRAQGVKAIVALIHEGGNSRDAFDTINCNTLEGPIVDIVKKLDKDIDAVMTGHTHRGYQCLVDGRLVVQGDSYGHLLTEINLKVDRASGEVTGVTSNNIVADAAKVAKDPAMTEIIARARAVSDPVANAPIAALAVEQVSRTATPAGTSPLGNLIADSQLAATRDASKGGAVIAFMNPGGIRADLPVNVPNPNRRVTYGDAFAVQPFGNSLTVLTLTGAQIKTLLEQQFDNPSAGQNRILQVSEGFAYTWDNAKPKGQKVDAASIKLNGQTIDPARDYRVTVNSFLADGGDNFVVLREGRNRVGGDVDIDALAAFLQAAEKAGRPITPAENNRVTRLN